MNPYKPQPDELAWGYRWRLGLLLGRRVIDPVVQSSGPGTWDVRNIKALSTFAGVEPSQFVARHTLMPFEGVATSTDDNVSFSLSNERRPRHKLFIPHNGVIYFCPQCQRDDRAALGYWYLRRRHHLPGIYHCNVHTESLRTAWHMPRQDGAECVNTLIQGQPCLDDDELRAILENDFIQRYTALAHHLLTLNEPITPRDYIQNFDGYLKNRIEIGDVTGDGMHWARDALKATGSILKNMGAKGTRPNFHHLSQWAKLKLPAIAPMPWIQKLRLDTEFFLIEKIVVLAFSRTTTGGRSTGSGLHRATFASLVCEDLPEIKGWFSPAKANAPALT